MSKLIQGEEKIVLVNHTTGETIHKAIRDLDEIVLIKTMQAMVQEGEFELEYLSGCLVGDACDAFIELCELARQYDEELEVVGKLFNACDGLEETKLILDYETYAIISAKSPSLAFREYLEELGDLASIPNHICQYIDFAKWLDDTSVQVFKTHTAKDGFDRDEFVVYNLI